MNETYNWFTVLAHGVQPKWPEGGDEMYVTNVRIRNTQQHKL